MSLITRCPACGTMFKVVADQLKISQGWVRCGQCAEVFDAAAHLQPRSAQVSAVAPAASSAPLAQAPADEVEAQALVQPASLLVAPAAADPAPDSGDLAPLAPALSLPEVQVSMPPDLAAEVFAVSVSPDHPSAFPGSAQQAPQDSSAFGESEALPQGDGQDVSFVRDARRSAFWRRPVMRWALGLAALVLLAALLLQVALVQRNTLVVQQPWLSPVLHALCKRPHCEIKAPQQIESLVIDSSSFSKIGPDAYRLKVVLKSTATIAVAMPSLELTLTDIQDQALLRRVLSPADIGATVSTLAPGAEFSAAIAIAITNPAVDGNASAASAPKPFTPSRITGYRVLAFYP